MNGFWLPQAYQHISIKLCSNTQHVVALALGWYKDKAQQQQHSQFKFAA